MSDKLLVQLPCVSAQALGGPVSGFYCAMHVLWYILVSKMEVKAATSIL